MYKDTNQVEESKINMLVYKYKLFKMKSYEIIIEIFIKFTIIINGLKSLGKSYINSEFVQKFLGHCQEVVKLRCYLFKKQRT